MTAIRLFSLAGLTLGLLFTPSLPAHALVAGGQDSSTHATDNSAKNKHHTQSGEVADHQSDATSDVKITAAIRRAIVGEKDLSTYAHNVKIITRNGAVTLKGPVKSEDEKQKVATTAASVVSADKITNQLTTKQ